MVSDLMYNEFASYLKCLLCDKTYNLDEVEYVCPLHGNDGRLNVIYNYERIKDEWSKNELKNCMNHTLWRYIPLLPINPVDLSCFLPVGFTPLYHAKKLGEMFGLKNLYLKLDMFNPTSSLKDRASIIAAAMALGKKKKIITAASSGNAAASLAGITANLDLQSVLFVPQTAPKEKIIQMKIHGATVFLVEDNYDSAFNLCLSASEKFGWYSRNTGYNPYLSEGKKTVIFEVIEQLNWIPPDQIFVPVGDGCILGSVGKGINDLLSIGWIDRKPRINGVQSEGAAAVYNAWKQGNEDIKPVKTNTLADSISVSLPRDGIKALRAVKESDGYFLKVSDKEILDAMEDLSRYAGVFAEPAGATGFAGLKDMLEQGKIDRDETIVVLITGSGLKDINSAYKASHNEVINLKPNIVDLEKKLKDI